MNIITWNVGIGKDKQSHSFDLLHQLIRESHPDIILLQEVPTESKRGEIWYGVKNTKKDPGVAWSGHFPDYRIFQTYSGTAFSYITMIKSLALGNRNTGELKRPQATYPFGTYVELDKYFIINVHLTANSTDNDLDANTVRQDQINIIEKTVKNKPTIIGGDYNTERPLELSNKITIPEGKFPTYYYKLQNKIQPAKQYDYIGFLKIRAIVQKISSYNTSTAIENSQHFHTPLLLSNVILY